MRFLTKTLACCLLLCTAAAAGAAEPGFLVIVNVNNPAASLPSKLVEGIFLKRTKTWSAGEPAKPVDLPVTSAAREAFSRAVHGKSANAIEEFWQHQIFSGRDVPPPRKASEEEVIDYVARYPGAVGYVTASTRLRLGVKVIPLQAEK
jgi:ABC-type phosphate transport system substrate-binding protein